MIETVLRPNPEIGRPGRVPGTREYVVPDSEYIVPYGSGVARSKSSGSTTARGGGRSCCRAYLPRIAHWSVIRFCPSKGRYSTAA